MHPVASSPFVRPRSRTRAQSSPDHTYSSIQRSTVETWHRFFSSSCGGGGSVHAMKLSSIHHSIMLKELTSDHAVWPATHQTGARRVTPVGWCDSPGQADGHVQHGCPSREGIETCGSRQTGLIALIPRRFTPTLPRSPLRDRSGQAPTPHTRALP